MHVVLNWKQFSHVNLTQLYAQMSTMHVKLGWILRYDSVLLLARGSFFGRCSVHLVGFSYIYVSYVQIMCSRWKTQLMRHSSDETRVKAVGSTYCVTRNIVKFTTFSSTALLTCLLVAKVVRLSC